MGGLILFSWFKSYPLRLFSSSQAKLRIIKLCVISSDPNHFLKLNKSDAMQDKVADLAQIELKDIDVQNYSLL